MYSYNDNFGMAMAILMSLAAACVIAEKVDVGDVLDLREGYQAEAAADEPGTDRIAAKPAMPGSANFTPLVMTSRR